VHPPFPKGILSVSPNPIAHSSLNPLPFVSQDPLPILLLLRERLSGGPAAGPGYSPALFSKNVI